MILKASPEEIRTAGKKLVANAESYLASVKAIYETVDNLKANWQGADNQQFAATVYGYKENIDALGQVRLEVARRLDLLDNSVYKMLWVTEFPLFEEDEETGRFIAKHHPFTSPVDEDLDKLESGDKASLRAKAYDIVINGYEVGGGSVRIFNSDVQKRMFSALGLSEEEAYEKFGFLLDAFKYGTPPHAGIAFGMDRLIMILAGTNNIKDVIAFPKNQSAVCPMTNAPAVADEEQLKELSIRVELEDKE